MLDPCASQALFVGVPSHWLSVASVDPWRPGSLTCPLAEFPQVLCPFACFCLHARSQDYHAQLPPDMRALSPAPPGSTPPCPDMSQMPMAGPAGPGSAPWAPMYSVLPLIREDGHMAVGVQLMFSTTSSDLLKHVTFANSLSKQPQLYSHRCASVCCMVWSHGG